MDLYSDDFMKLNAPPAVEINIRPNVLYTEEYSYLTKDELEVLFLLATTEMSSEGLTSFSFSGIKRQLGKHQQKITKAVNRLLEKDLICKNGTGYSISIKGTSILSEIIKLQNAIDLHYSIDEYYQQVIHFDKKISIDSIASLLIGKWFGSFRYLSHTEGKNLVIRWQLVDSRASAILFVYDDVAILNIIPDKNDPQKFSYEQTLIELSQYFIEVLTSKGIKATIISEGWYNSTISELEYQQKLTSWLNSFNKAISEN